jgi:hypothetical protein
VVTPFEAYLFGIAVLVAFFLLFAAFWVGWWLTRKEASLSPYTGLPLRPATGISYMALERVYRFLYNFQQYENRIFDIKRAALCRDTGRIFPDCITWYDAIRADWSFIQKRFPGHYVSWGSLSEEQQETLKSAHGSLEGFQTVYSSPRSSPRLVEPKYAMEKPGPLYVEIKTGTLVGWMCVPDTELEVLIVQKPLKIIMITLPKEKER